MREKKQTDSALIALNIYFFNMLILTNLISVYNFKYIFQISIVRLRRKI